MKKIITLVGSNSKSSINRQLVNYTTQLFEHIAIQDINLRDYKLPFYSVDYESSNGIPSNVNRLNERLKTADGFVLSLAEHNGSYVAEFKNTIDWLSRADAAFWNHKPMLLMSTSPGGRGGANVLEAARTGFPFLGANVVESFLLPSFYQNFSNGKIIDDTLSKMLEDKVAYFINAINKLQTSPQHKETE